MVMPMVDDCDRDATMAFHSGQTEKSGVRNNSVGTHCVEVAIIVIAERCGVGHCPT